MDKETKEQLLSRGTADVLPSAKALEKRLAGKKMRVYYGIDPTSPTLHIGHAIGLRKLKSFQDLGHEVILLIGSFTAMIGDPTDKLAVRTALTQKEVLKNAATYKKQASKILSFSGRNAAKIMFNHKWLSKLSFADVAQISSHFTVQQMSERDMFSRRMKDGKPVHLHEFLYPLMQGYDSVAMDVDLEIGGSDQLFNMLAGRTLMKKMSDKEKFVMTLKLLENDEGKKMSKSEGGFIALTDAPEDMYGKIMAMDDSMILPYFELATDVSQDEIAGMKVQLKKGVNPRDLKAKLAYIVVETYIGSKEADAAGVHFDRVFKRHEIPEDLLQVSVSKKMNIIDALVKAGLVDSKSDARRQINQGAIKVDGVVVTSLETELRGSAEGIVLQRGKRRFVRLVR
jgi:tyrosyl-tRNA synthetase